MLTLNFHPFPVLTTDRLVLRQVSEADAEEILFLRSDPAVLQYIDRPPARQIDDALRFVSQANASIASNESILWGITLKGQSRLLGTAGFWQMETENHRAEIGYVLHTDYHRQGIMLETLQAILQYGFDVMGLHTVVANINPGNNASRQLLKRLNFKQEAYFRENYFFNGKFLDSEIYVLLDADAR